MTMTIAPHTAGTATNLSNADLQQLALGAGFTGDDIPIAAAVALAESGGNPKSHNSTPPDDSYGLWQINMLGAMGPARRKQFGITSNEQLFDPSTNAKAAHTVWKGSGWKAWTTYTSGKYKDHMSADTGGLSVSATDNTPTGIAGAITNGINNIGQTFINGTASAAGLVAALVLLVLGIVILARSQVGNLLPASKVVKTVKKVTG
jgi:hypothetical protein